MPRINLVRIAVGLGLLTALTLAKASNIPYLDPFANHLLDYPQAIPTLNTSTIIPTLDLSPRTIPYTFASSLNQTLALLTPQTPTIARIIEGDGQGTVTVSQTGSSSTNERIKRDRPAKPTPVVIPQAPAPIITPNAPVVPPTTTNPVVVAPPPPSSEAQTPSKTTGEVEQTSPPTSPKPEPVSGADILQETYAEQNTLADGVTVEKYRFGYQLTPEDTYKNDPYADRAIDGLGSVAGTYVTSDGTRHIIAVASTQKAAQEFTQAVKEKVATITDEQLVATAAKDPNLTCHPALISCQEEALNNILDQALVTDPTVKNEIIEVRAKAQEQTKTLNQLFNQATRSIDPDLFIKDCMDKNSYADDAAEHCQLLLNNADTALTTLSDPGTEKDPNPYYSPDLVGDIQTAQKAIEAQKSGNTQKYQVLSTTIQDSAILEYTQSVVETNKQIEQNKLAEIISTSLQDCTNNDQMAPDVRNACLQRYANEKEQTFYSYDGNLVDRTVTPTLQQAYLDTGKITQEVKDSVDKNIKERVATSELAYLINQMDLGRTTTTYTPVDQLIIKDGKIQEPEEPETGFNISSLTDPILDNLSDDNPNKDMLTCRSNPYNVYAEGECITVARGNTKDDIADTATQRRETSGAFSLNNFVDCGKDGQPACVNGKSCDPGYVLIGDTCKRPIALSTSEIKAKKLAELAYDHFTGQTYTATEFENYIQSLSNGNGLNTQDTLFFLHAQLSDNISCTGAVIYSQDKGQFDCVPKLVLTAQYASIDKNAGKNGEINGKCKGLFNTCNSDTLSCDKTTDTCVLTEGAMYAIAQNFVVSSVNSTTGLTVEQIKALNLSRQVASYEIEPYLSSVEIARTQAIKVPKDNSFFSVGSCWKSLDPKQGTVQQLPTSLCIATNKTALLNNLPDVKCHQAGGYYSTSTVKDSGVSQVSGIDGCYKASSKEYALPGEQGVSNYASRYVTNLKRCAPGLIELNGICQEDIVAANTPSFSRGVLASAWEENNILINKIPIVKEWVGSMIRALEVGSYHKSIDIRAQYNLDTRVSLNNSDLDLPPNIHAELTSYLDQAAAARETAIIAKQNSQALKQTDTNTVGKWVNNILERRFNTIYIAGTNIWQFASAWTGEDPYSRGGNSGTNAFYEYAAANEEINRENLTQGKITTDKGGIIEYFDQLGTDSWTRAKTTGKPAIQAAFVVGDAIPVISGAGKLIEKTGARIGSNALNRTGQLLQRIEPTLVNISKKTIGRITVTPASKLISAGGSQLAKLSVIKSASTGLSKTFSSVGSTLDNLFRGFSESSTMEKLISDSLEQATKEALEKGETASIDDLIYRAKQLAKENALDSANRQLKNVPPTDLEVRIADYFGSDTVSKILKQTGELTENSLRSAKLTSNLVEKYSLKVPESSLGDLTIALRELEEQALKSGPLTEKAVVERLAQAVGEDSASWVAKGLIAENSFVVAGTNILGRPIAVTQEEFAKRIERELGFGADNAVQLAAQLDSPLVKAPPTPLSERFSLPWTKPQNKAVSSIDNEVKELRDYLDIVTANHPDRQVDALTLVQDMVDSGMERDKAIRAVSVLIDEENAVIDPIIKLGKVDKFLAGNETLARMTKEYEEKSSQYVAKKEAKTIKTLLTENSIEIKKTGNTFKLSPTTTSNLDDTTRQAIDKINTTLTQDAQEIADMLGYTKGLKEPQVKDALNIRLNLAEGNTSALINTELPGFGKTPIDDLLTKWGVEEHGIVIRNQASLGAIRDVANPRATSTLFKEPAFISLENGQFYLFKQSSSQELLEGSRQIAINSVSEMDELIKNGAVIFSTMDESGWKAAMGKGIKSYGNGDDLARWYYELTQTTPYQLFDEAHLGAGRQWVVRLDVKKLGKLSTQELATHFSGLKPNRMQTILDEVDNANSLNNFRSGDHALRPDGKPVDAKLYRDTHLELIDQELASRNIGNDAREYLLTLRNELDKTGSLSEFDDVLRNASHPQNIPEKARVAMNELKLRQQSAETVWDMRGKKIAGDDFIYNKDADKIEYAKRAISTSETPQSAITQYVEDKEGRRIFNELGINIEKDTPALNNFEFSLNQVSMTPQELMQKGIGQTGTADRIAAALDASVVGGEIPPLKTGRVTTYNKQVDNLYQQILNENQSQLENNSLFIKIEDAGPDGLKAQEKRLLEEMVESGRKPKMVALADNEGYYIITFEEDAAGKLVPKYSDLITNKAEWESHFIDLDGGIKLKSELKPEDFVLITERREQFDPTKLAELQDITLLSEGSAYDNTKQILARDRSFSIQEDASIKNRVKFLTDQGYTADQADKILKKEPIYVIREVDEGIVDTAGRYHPVEEFAGLNKAQIELKLREMDPKPGTSIRLTTSVNNRYSFNVRLDKSIDSFVLDSSDNFSRLFADNLTGELKTIRLQGDLTRLKITEESIFDQIERRIGDQIDNSSRVGQQVDSLFTSASDNRTLTHQFNQASFARGEVTGADAYYNALSDYNTRLNSLLDNLDQIGLNTSSLRSELGLNSQLIAKDDFLTFFGQRGNPSPSSLISPQDLADNFLATRSYDNIPYNYVAPRESYSVAAPFTSTSNLTTLTNSTSGIAQALNIAGRSPTTSFGVKFWSTLAINSGVTAPFKAVFAAISNKPTVQNVAIKLYQNGTSATEQDIKQVVDTANNLNLNNRDTYTLAETVLSASPTLSTTSIVKIGNGQIRQIIELLENGPIVVTQGDADITITTGTDLNNLVIDPSEISSITYTGSAGNPLQIPSNNVYVHSNILALLDTATENQRQVALNNLGIEYTFQIESQSPSKSDSQQPPQTNASITQNGLILDNSLLENPLTKFRNSLKAVPSKLSITPDLARFVLPQQATLTTRFAQAIGRLWALVTPNQPIDPDNLPITQQVNKGTAITDAITSTPTLGNRFITGLLQDPDFNSLAFNLSNGNTIAFYMSNNQLGYIDEQGKTRVVNINQVNDLLPFDNQVVSIILNEDQVITADSYSNPQRVEQYEPPTTDSTSPTFTQRLRSLGATLTRPVVNFSNWFKNFFNTNETGSFLGFQQLISPQTLESKSAENQGGEPTSAQTPISSTYQQLPSKEISQDYAYSQQDSFSSSQGEYIVNSTSAGDGVGSAVDSHLGSQYAVISSIKGFEDNNIESFPKTIFQHLRNHNNKINLKELYTDILNDIIMPIHASINQDKSRLRNTTLSNVSVVEHNGRQYYAGFVVGDSPVFLLRNDKLYLLSPSGATENIYDNLPHPEEYQAYYDVEHTSSATQVIHTVKNDGSVSSAPHQLGGTPLPYVFTGQALPGDKIITTSDGLPKTFPSAIFKNFLTVARDSEHLLTLINNTAIEQVDDWSISMINVYTPITSLNNLDLSTLETIISPIYPPNSDINAYRAVTITGDTFLIQNIDPHLDISGIASNQHQLILEDDGSYTLHLLSRDLVPEWHISVTRGNNIITFYNDTYIPLLPGDVLNIPLKNNEVKHVLYQGTSTATNKDGHEYLVPILSTDTRISSQSTTPQANGKPNEAGQNGFLSTLFRTPDDLVKSLRSLGASFARPFVNFFNIFPLSGGAAPQSNDNMSVNNLTPIQELANIYSDRIPNLSTQISTMSLEQFLSDSRIGAVTALAENNPKFSSITDKTELARQTLTELYYREKPNERPTQQNSPVVGNRALTIPAQQLEQPSKNNPELENYFEKLKELVTTNFDFSLPYRYLALEQLPTGKNGEEYKTTTQNETQDAQDLIIKEGQKIVNDSHDTLRVTAADTRNRRNATTNQPVIKLGSAIHGIKSIDQALDKGKLGILAGEYYGGNSGNFTARVFTSYFGNKDSKWDFGSKTPGETLEQIAYNQYNAYFVLEGIVPYTTQTTGKANTELAIILARTIGIPATNISSIILTSDTDLDKAIESVLNFDFYVPIYNVAGNLLFSPEDYDRLNTSTDNNIQIKASNHNNQLTQPDNLTVTPNITPTTLQIGIANIFTFGPDSESSIYYSQDLPSKLLKFSTQDGYYGKLEADKIPNTTSKQATVKFYWPEYNWPKNQGKFDNLTITLNGNNLDLTNTTTEYPINPGDVIVVNYGDKEWTLRYEGYEARSYSEDYQQTESSNSNSEYTIYLPVLSYTEDLSNRSPSPLLFGALSASTLATQLGVASGQSILSAISSTIGAPLATLVNSIPTLQLLPTQINTWINNRNLFSKWLKGQFKSTILPPLPLDHQFIRDLKSGTLSPTETMTVLSNIVAYGEGYQITDAINYVISQNLLSSTDFQRFLAIISQHPLNQEFASVLSQSAQSIDISDEYFIHIINYIQENATSDTHSTLAGTFSLRSDLHTFSVNKLLTIFEFVSTDQDQTLKPWLANNLAGSIALDNHHGDNLSYSLEYVSQNATSHKQSILVDGIENILLKEVDRPHHSIQDLLTYLNFIHSYGDYHTATKLVDIIPHLPKEVSDSIMNIIITHGDNNTATQLLEQIFNNNLPENQASKAIEFIAQRGDLNTISTIIQSIKSGQVSTSFITLLNTQQAYYGLILYRLHEYISNSDLQRIIIYQNAYGQEYQQLLTQLTSATKDSERSNIVGKLRKIELSVSQELTQFEKMLSLGGQLTTKRDYELLPVLLHKIDQSYNRNYYEHYRELAEHFNVQNWRSRTQAGVIEEISNQIETVSLKPSTYSFDIQTQSIEKNISPDHQSQLLGMIEQLPDSEQSLGEILSTLSQPIDNTPLIQQLIDAQTDQVKLDRLLSEFDQTTKQKALGILGANMSRELKSNSLTQVLSIRPIQPDNLSVIMGTIFQDAGLTNLLAKLRNSNITPEEQNLLLTKLSELQTNIFPEFALDHNIDQSTQASIKKSAIWQLINQININTANLTQKQEKNNKTVSLILGDRTLLDVWQGVISGTCLGDHPYFLSKRSNIVPIKMVIDDKVIGNALIIIQGNKVILKNINPGEAFVSGISQETLLEFVDQTMQGIAFITKQNNWELLIAVGQEVGGLSNRELIEDYIASQYLTGSTQIKIKEEAQLHPRYGYKPVHAYKLSADIKSRLNIVTPPSPLLFGALSTSTLATKLGLSSGHSILSAVSSWLPAVFTSIPTLQHDITTWLSNLNFTKTWFNWLGGILKISDFQNIPDFVYSQDDSVPYVDNIELEYQDFTVTRQDIPLNNAAPVWNIFKNFGFSAWIKGSRDANSPITLEEIIARILNGSRVILLASGLDSNSNEYDQHLIEEIFKQFEGEDVIILGVNSPGFGLSQLKENALNIENVGIDQYREMVRNFALALGLNRENTVLVGHSAGGEMAFGMGKVFDHIVLLTQANHPKIDLNFLTLATLNNIGYQANKIKPLKPVVYIIRKAVTRWQLRDANGWPTEEQLYVHLFEQFHNELASILKDRELIYGDRTLTFKDKRILLDALNKRYNTLLGTESLAMYLTAITGSSDVLTPEKASIAALNREIKAENRVGDKNIRQISVEGMGHTSTFTDPKYAEQVAKEIHGHANLLPTSEPIPVEVPSFIPRENAETSPTTSQFIDFPKPTSFGTTPLFELGTRLVDWLRSTKIHQAITHIFNQIFSLEFDILPPYLINTDTTIDLNEHLNIAPLTHNEKITQLKPESLSQLSTEEYIALWRKLNPYYLAHVTKQGFADHDVMIKHFDEQGQLRQNFTSTAQGKELLPLLTLNYFSNRDFKTIEKFIEENILDHAKNREEAIQEFDSLLHWSMQKDIAPTYPDLTSIHFSAQEVESDYYGTETDNTIFYIFPTDALVSQYNFSMIGNTQDLRGAHNSTEWNDIFVWPKDPNTGIPIDSGFVFLPKSTPVNSETGSIYATTTKVIDGVSQEIVVVDNSLIDKYLEWTSQGENIPQLLELAQDRQQTSISQFNNLCTKELRQLGFSESSIKTLVPKLKGLMYLNNGQVSQADYLETINSSNAKYKKAENTVTSQEYWENYFTQHPNSRPKHIVYYDGQPTEAVNKFLSSNNIILHEESTPLLTFEQQYVADMTNDPRANKGHQELIKIGTQIIEDHFSPLLKLFPSLKNSNKTTFHPESFVNSVFALLPSIQEPELTSTTYDVDLEQIRKHTIQVLQNFENYIKIHPLPSNIDLNYMRLIIALHDSGKALAPSSGLQSKYNIDIINKFFERNKLDSHYQKIATQLVGQDLIGLLLKDINPDKQPIVEQTAKQIIEISRQSNLDPNTVTDLAITLHKVDAKSYISLQFLFTKSEENGDIKYSAYYQSLINQVIEIIEHQP